MNRIGIDLGGTKIEGILLDCNGDILKRKRIPTRQDNGYDSIIQRIGTLGNDLFKLGSSATKIGICSPGTIIAQSGLMKNSNIISLNNRSLLSDLQNEFSVPVIIENDANCFALAEATLGAGQGFDIVFGVIMGTGVGGGIIINRVVHRGPNYIAGEWGHHVLYPDGRDCYCGNKGCTETYISGPALEKEWLDLSGNNKTVPEIIKQEQSDKYFIWINQFIINFGKALSHVIDILDPDAIVLGGGLSNIEMLYTKGRDEVYKETFCKNVVTPILKNQLGDSAGVFGAAYLE